MNIVELLLIAVGLSMDAFAVAVCKGLSMKKCTVKKAMLVGAWFGIFQGGMPLIGYFLGVQFKEIITSIDHWIAFVLLGMIGGNMIREAFCEEEAECAVQQESLDVRTMFGLAIATSIDALAIGVTFAFLQVKIVPASKFYRNCHLYSISDRCKSWKCIWRKIQQKGRNSRRSYSYSVGN